MNKKPVSSKSSADKLVKNIRRKTRQAYSAEENKPIVDEIELGSNRVQYDYEARAMEPHDRVGKLR